MHKDFSFENYASRFIYICLRGRRRRGPVSCEPRSRSQAHEMRSGARPTRPRAHRELGGNCAVTPAAYVLNFFPAGERGYLTRHLPSSIPSISPARSPHRCRFPSPAPLPAQVLLLRLTADYLEPFYTRAPRHLLNFC